MSEEYKGPNQEKAPREFTTEELVPYWHKIVAAIKAAPLEEEQKEVEDAQDEAESLYIQGGGGHEEIEKNQGTAEPHIVKFPDFETLLAAFTSNDILVRLLPEDQIQAMIEHERAHLETAQKHGYSTEIGLTITRRPEGTYAFTPFITVSVDLAEVDQEKIRKHLKEIAGAPGEDVSDSDKKKA